MGIQGLLPFLKKSSVQCNVRQFKGQTVAIDSYCWLHKGAFACAEKLAMGEKTDQYVYYCLKYLNMLLMNDIKPIMVFDGCRLPSKHEVEKARRERRDANRKKAGEYLREGRRSEARDCLTQCIDITPTMALELMKACREKGVDCIVAPYEADAQLAYLNKIGMAQLIITEDSDLILFGADKILFKMDISGNGIFIEKEKLNLSFELPIEVYDFEKCRRICILSGCDYLPSLPGIGISKATKVFKLSRQTDIRQVIRKLPSTLKMSNLCVTEDYIEGFMRAENTFLYQLVYNPTKRSLVPLTPYPSDLDPSQLMYAGPHIDDERALQIALGNINVITGEIICDFDPDISGTGNRRSSIWSGEYKTKRLTSCDQKIETCTDASTRGKQLVVTVPSFKLKHIDKSQHLKTDLGQLTDIYITNDRLQSPSSNSELALNRCNEDLLLQRNINGSSTSKNDVDSASPAKKKNRSLSPIHSFKSDSSGHCLEGKLKDSDVVAKDLVENTEKINFLNYDGKENIEINMSLSQIISPKKKKVPTASLR